MMITMRTRVKQGSSYRKVISIAVQAANHMYACSNSESLHRSCESGMRQRILVVPCKLCARFCKHDCNHSMASSPARLTCELLSLSIPRAQTLTA